MVSNNVPDLSAKLMNLKNAASLWYALPQRHYHTLGHAITVEAAVYKIDPQASEAVKLAAIWHDAVYVPGASSSSNEACSAAALSFEARSPYFVELSETVEAAARLIPGTATGYHLTSVELTGDIAILLDADLHGLGSPYYTQFLADQVNVVKEHLPFGREVGKDSLNKQAQLLGTLVERRKHIYHTEAARDFYEDYATKNIRRFLEETQ